METTERTWSDDELQQHVNNVAESEQDRYTRRCEACVEAKERGIEPTVPDPRR